MGNTTYGKIHSVVENGKPRDYFVVDGTYYDIDTPHEVIKWLETSRTRGQRIRIFYGDMHTGLDWLQEHHVIGTVGRSTGNIKIPLMIANTRSLGGDAILTANIVKITVDKKIVYKHPNYTLPKLEISKNNGSTRQYPWFVYNGYDVREIYAQFDSYDKALRWAEFMRGNRNSK